MSRERAVRNASRRLRLLPDLPLHARDEDGRIVGRFHGLPSDIEWGRIVSDVATLTGFHRLTPKIRNRIKRYTDEINARESYRRETLGMNEHGVTKGMQDYLASQKTT